MTDDTKDSLDRIYHLEVHVAMGKYNPSARNFSPTMPVHYIYTETAGYYTSIAQALDGIQRFNAILYSKIFRYKLTEYAANCECRGERESIRVYISRDELEEACETPVECFYHRENKAGCISYKGRTPDKIRFRKGDIVTLIDKDNYLCWGIVACTPPTVEDVAGQRLVSEPQYWHNSNDDCYFVVGTGVDNKIFYRYVECVDVFAPPVAVPPQVAEGLQKTYRTFMEQTFTYNDFKILKRYFRNRPKRLKTFLQYAETGRTMNLRRILYLLADMYMRYCGISLSYRSLADYLGICVKKHYIGKGATEFRQDDSFNRILSRLHPDYSEEQFGRWDITALQTEQVVKYCIDAVCHEALGDEYCAALCFGLLIYVQYDEFYFW
jgi:hypothetical protein